MLTENDFASIKTMIDSAVGEIGQTLITSQVLKRDEARKLVWISELGDQPIPVVDFNRMVDVYSFANYTDTWHYVGAAGEPAFQNGWTNYDASNYSSTAFWKDPFGIVHIKGFVRSGTLSAAAFTLPAGYRPALALHLPAAANGAYATTRIGGEISGITGIGIGEVQPSVNNTWYSLEAITFPAAPTPAQLQKRSEISAIQVPALGDTVVVALERGTRRLPRCLGVIQSTDYIRPGDD